TNLHSQRGSMDKNTCPSPCNLRLPMERGDAPAERRGELVLIRRGWPRAQRDLNILLFAIAQDRQRDGLAHLCLLEQVRRQFFKRAYGLLIARRDDVAAKWRFLALQISR